MTIEELKQFAWEYFNERAGIVEHDGGKFRAQAESSALNSTGWKLLDYCDNNTAIKVMDWLKEQIKNKKG